VSASLDHKRPDSVELAGVLMVAEDDRHSQRAGWVGPRTPRIDSGLSGWITAECWHPGAMSRELILTAAPFAQRQIHALTPVI
jgi:hypothetical protein